MAFHPLLKLQPQRKDAKESKIKGIVGKRFPVVSSSGEKGTDLFPLYIFQENGIQSMNKESTSIELIESTRALLATSAKRIPLELQSDISRKINLIAVRFVEEDDPVLSLSIVALVGLAKSKGNKDAAKKSLTFVKWISNPPPPLESLPTVQERLAAVRMLTALRASWVSGYAISEVLKDNNSRELAAPLLAWAYASCDSLGEFLSTIATQLEKSGQCSGSKLRLIHRLSINKLTENVQDIGPSWPTSFNVWVDSLSMFAEKVTLPKTDRAVLQGWILETADIVTAQEPAMLLDVSTIDAVRKAGAIGGGWATSSKKRLGWIGVRLLSTGLWIAGRYGIDGRNGMRAIFRYAKDIFVLDKVARRFSEQRQLLQSLFQEGEEEESVDMLRGSLEIQEQIAALLIVWEKLHLGLKNQSEAAELGLQIEAVSAAASIRCFGDVGQITTYQPLDHKLMQTTAGMPSTVKVEVPGVRSERGDGSYRVLIKAVVSAVH